MYVRTVTTNNSLYQTGRTAALEFSERQMVRLITLITQTCRGSFTLMSAVEQYGVMAQLAALWIPRTVIQGVQQGVSAIQSERQNRALMPPPPPGIPHQPALQPIPTPLVSVQPSPNQELQTLRQRVTQLLSNLRTRGNQLAVVSLSRVINALSSHRDCLL